MLRPTYAHSTFNHSIACNETFSRPSVVACSDTSGKECLQNRCGGDLAMFVATMALFGWLLKQVAMCKLTSLHLSVCTVRFDLRAIQIIRQNILNVEPHVRQSRFMLFERRSRFLRNFLQNSLSSVLRDACGLVVSLAPSESCPREPVWRLLLRGKFARVP